MVIFKNVIHIQVCAFGVFHSKVKKLVGACLLPERVMLPNILKLLNKKEMHVTTSLYARLHLMPCLAQLFPTPIPNPKDQVYKGLQRGKSPALPLDFLFGAQISRPVHVYLRLWM